MNGPMLGFMSYLWWAGAVYFGMHDSFIGLTLFIIGLFLFFLYIKASYVVYRILDNFYNRKMDPEYARWIMSAMREMHR